MSYSEYPVRPIAGRMVLDFLNTADWSDAGEVIHEKLVGMDDLQKWTVGMGIADAVAADAPPALKDLKVLRGHLRGVVLAAIGEGAASADSLRALSRILPGHQGKVAFPASGKTSAPPVTGPLIGLIAASAVAVLSDLREIKRVKLCPGQKCGWIFLDESRNATRKWCLMETCGNREKARRHHARAKAKARG